MEQLETSMLRQRLTAEMKEAMKAGDKAKLATDMQKPDGLVVLRKA